MTDVAGTAVHRVSIVGGDTFPVHQGERILTAARRAGTWLPFECGWGGCGTCKVTVVEGETELLYAGAVGRPPGRASTPGARVPVDTDVRPGDPGRARFRHTGAGAAGARPPRAARGPRGARPRRGPVPVRSRGRRRLPARAARHPRPRRRPAPVLLARRAAGLARGELHREALPRTPRQQSPVLRAQRARRWPWSCPTATCSSATATTRSSSSRGAPASRPSWPWRSSWPSDATPVPSTSSTAPGRRPSWSAGTSSSGRWRVSTTATCTGRCSRRRSVGPAQSGTSPRRWPQRLPQLTDAVFHVAGPPPMTDATVDLLRDNGIQLDRVHFDSFG